MQNQLTNRAHSNQALGLRQSRRFSWGAYLLITPALMLFFFFFVLPLGVMTAMSLLSGNPVNDPDVSFTIKNYLKLTEDIFFSADKCGFSRSDDAFRPANVLSNAGQEFLLA